MPDIKLLNVAVDLARLPPEQLVLDIMEQEKRFAELMMEIKQILT